jgi:type IV pilus assembly protein PilE
LLLLDTRNYGTVTATVTAYYSMSVAATSTAAVNEFTATAVPRNSQAEDKCGTLTVNHLNVKTPTGCW